MLATNKAVEMVNGSDAPSSNLSADLLSDDDPRARLIDPAMPVPPGNYIEGEFVVATGSHVITRTFTIVRDGDLLRIKELIGDSWQHLFSFPESAITTEI